MSIWYTRELVYLGTSYFTPVCVMISWLDRIMCYNKLTCLRIMLIKLAKIFFMDCEFWVCDSATSYVTATKQVFELLKQDTNLSLCTDLLQKFMYCNTIVNKYDCFIKYIFHLFRHDDNHDWKAHYSHVLQDLMDIISDEWMFMHVQNKVRTSQNSYNMTMYH